MDGVHASLCCRRRHCLKYTLSLWRENALIAVGAAKQRSDIFTDTLYAKGFSFYTQHISDWLNINYTHLTTQSWRDSLCIERLHSSPLCVYQNMGTTPRTLCGGNAAIFIKVS